MTSYSSAPEILQYFKAVADEYGLRRYVRLNHRVVSAVWDEVSQEWKLRIQRGNDPNNIIEDQCNVLINASGVLKYAGGKVLTFGMMC